MSGNYYGYASIIVDLAVGKSLDYGIPPEMANAIRKGIRVEVPVRGRPCGGYVYEVKEKSEFSSVKPISKILSESELITKDGFELALWISRFYLAPLNQVLKSMMPASIRKKIQPKEQLYVMRKMTRDQLREITIEIRNKHPAQAAVLDAMLMVNKGILLSELLEATEGSRSPVDTLVKKGCLSVDSVRIDRSPLINEDYFKTKSKTLNPDQQTAFNQIINSLEGNRFETHLLHGVTGSGKTEIYLQAIDKALSLGKSAIMLVPEISLTAQTIHHFRSRFEGKIAILHHRLSDGERYDTWYSIRNGEAKIVIGARSAIFCPVQDLGLIIVDEEHEQSYKQTDEGPCYHARDIAVMRGKLTQSTVILGSATPSLESFHNAKSGKYTLSTLNVRAENASQPNVTIVDMKREYEKQKGFTTFSEVLLDGIKKRHEVGEQTILFLNRRGYHTTLLCQSCKEAVKCAHCDVSLTFHKNEDALACHLCGYTLKPPPSKCPKCQSEKTMKYKGIGTELVEKSLLAIFPEIRTIRLDGDTTRHKGSHQKLLREFGTGKADVMIGTQMIAKGLHFPEVTLVGVLNSDSSLNIPDYRSSETTFQLITQVSGRAGRGVLPGEVIIQTCMPENSTIIHAGKNDYMSFYNEEIAIREMFGYPPFQSMVKILFTGKHQHNTLDAAIKFRQQVIPHLSEDFQIHPVLPAAHARVKDQFRFQFIIRGPSITIITRVLEKLTEKKLHSSSIKMLIDVNPLSTY
jgi:primosomal protein N' (replication factor Y)